MQAVEWTGWGGALSVTCCCVILGKRINLSVLQFPPHTSNLTCVLTGGSEKTFGSVDSHVYGKSVPPPTLSRFFFSFSFCKKFVDI